MDIRFSFLARRASDIGIGRGITSIHCFSTLSSNGERGCRCRSDQGVKAQGEDYASCGAEAPQSIRMIHFRFFIIASVGGEEGQVARLTS
jgi:hypothetical protein